MACLLLLHHRLDRKRISHEKQQGKAGNKQHDPLAQFHGINPVGELLYMLMHNYSASGVLFSTKLTCGLEGSSRERCTDPWCSAINRGSSGMSCR